MLMQSLAAVEHSPEEVVALIKKYVWVYRISIDTKLLSSNRDTLRNQQYVILVPTRSSKRKGAKIGEGSSVKANWLCIGCK